MKNVYTLLVGLCASLSIQAQCSECFYVDYSIGNFDDTTTFWRLNSRDTPNDSSDINYAAIGIVGPLQGYYDPNDIDNTLNFWNYYYNPITIDSVFAFVNHANHSELTDTIVIEIVTLDAALKPTNTVLWRDSIFTNTSLANTRLAVAPNYTTTNNQKTGINLKYFGADNDTFWVVAGAVNEMATTGVAVQSNYQNSWTRIPPNIPGVTKNAIIGYGSPVGADGWFEAQNWKISTFMNNSGFVDPPWPTNITENPLAQTKLYPNPATDVIQLQLPNTLVGSVSIQMLNSLGQLVKAEVVANASGKTVGVDVSALPAGLYMLQLQNGEAVKGFKVVVSN